jgi:hypothetical protein
MDSGLAPAARPGMTSFIVLAMRPAPELLFKN